MPVHVVNKQCNHNFKDVGTSTCVNSAYLRFKFDVGVQCFSYYRADKTSYVCALMAQSGQFNKKHVCVVQCEHCPQGVVTH